MTSSMITNKFDTSSDNGFDSKNLVKVAFEAALEKKATDIMALDMKDLLVVTDYFVIATGNNDLQVKAIATEIEKQLHEQCQARPAHREGLDEGKWVLLDYTDIVIHLFQPDFRDEYRLEDLWSQAKKLRAQTSNDDKAEEEKSPSADNSAEGNDSARIASQTGDQ